MKIKYLRDNKGRFIKGSIGFPYKHSEETKKRLSEIQKERAINDNQRRGLALGRIARKGFKATEETKKKLRLSHLGIRPSWDTKLKMSKVHKERMTPDMIRRCLHRRPMSGLEIKVNKI